MLGLCGRREGGRDRCRAVLWVRAECELVVLDLLIGVCSKRMLTMLGGRKRGAQHHRFFFFFAFLEHLLLPLGVIFMSRHCARQMTPSSLLSRS